MYNISISNKNVLNHLPKLGKYQLYFQKTFRNLNDNDDIELDEILCNLDEINLYLYRCLADYKQLVDSLENLKDDLIGDRVRIYHFVLIRDTLNLARSIYLFNLLLDRLDNSNNPLSLERLTIRKHKDYSKFASYIRSARNVFDHPEVKIIVSKNRARYQFKRLMNINNHLVPFIKGKQYHCTATQKTC